MMFISLGFDVPRSLSNLARSHAAPLLIAGALFLGGVTTMRAQLPGSVDPAFAPMVRGSGSVAVIARQPDGKQVIGGNFSRIGAVTVPSLARLNADGTIDTGFTPPTGNGFVYYVTVGADGKIFVLYELPTDSSGNYEILRLNADGSPDAGFAPVTFAGIFSSDELYPFVLAVQADGKLLVAGDFSTDTSSAYAIRRYTTSGRLDAGFKLPGTLSPSSIDSLQPLPNGQLLASGDFNDFSSPSSPILSLVRLNADGSRDGSYSVDYSQARPVFGLTLQPDGKLLYLTTANASYGLGGLPRRLNADGTLDTSFTPQVDASAVFDTLLLQPDGKIVVGGYLSGSVSQDGTATTQSGVVRFNADGTTDPAFNAAVPLVEFQSSALNQITALGLQPDGQLLIGGAFQTFAGVLHPGLGRLNTSGGTDSTFAADVTNAGEGYAVVVPADGQPILADSGPVINGTSASSLTRFGPDGSLKTIFAANLSSDQVYYSGGPFTTTTPILALQPDGKVLLTGSFDPFSGNYTADVKRFNADGSLDASFVPGQSYSLYTYSVLKAVVPQEDGHLYVAGGIATGYGRTTYPLNRLNADGSLDPAFVPADDPGASRYRGSIIDSLAIQPDGKVIAAGGFITPVNGQARPGVLRFNVDGSVDQSFNPGVFSNAATGFSGLASIVALQADGKVLVGGAFTAIGGVAANNLARLNADGSVDSSFNAGTGPEYGPLSMAVQADGKILLGGAFTEVNGTPLAGVARLLANGTVDSQFNPGTGTAGTGDVNSLALAPNGTVIVAGTFTRFGGQARDGVARLIGGDIPPVPVISSGQTASGEVGQAFSYQIAASNNPTRFGATGLPAGLSVSARTGLVSGTPTAAGTYAVTISATNAGGTGTARLTLTFAPDLPGVTLTATTPTVTAGTGTIGEFMVNLSAPQDHDVIVNLLIKGSAVNGSDYVLLKTTKKIKAGKTSKPVKIVPIGSGAGAGVKRVVTFLLAPGTGYTVSTTGKVKVKIVGQ